MEKVILENNQIQKLKPSDYLPIHLGNDGEVFDEHKLLNLCQTQHRNRFPSGSIMLSPIASI